MKIAVIIPTYNEAENIKNLIPIIFEEFKKMPKHTFDVLVVDGNSTDNTGQIVTQLAMVYENLHLLPEEKKAGLGAAYVYGFRYAMKELKADALVEMDADFQHDPKDLVRLIAELDAGYDYIIGSRFTKGGSIPSEWAIMRKLQSWGGNIVSKLVLWIFDVNDFTSGFKVTRVKGFADQLGIFDELSRGFAYKIQLLFRIHKLGAKFKEVPIAFGLRDRGTSKMERNNAIDSLKAVLQIRLHESRHFVKFIVVGFAGLFTDTLLFNALRLALSSSNSSNSSATTAASAISGLVAMTATYVLNNTWSFKDRKIMSFSKTLISIGMYYFFSYLPILFRSWLVGFAVNTFGTGIFVANGAFFVGIVLGLVWNFTIYSKIIWRKDAGSK